MHFKHEYGVNKERDEIFDNIMNGIKERAAEQNNTLNHEEAVEATDRLIQYVELAIEIHESQEK